MKPDIFPEAALWLSLYLTWTGKQNKKESSRFSPVLPRHITATPYASVTPITYDNHAPLSMYSYIPPLAHSPLQKAKGSTISAIHPSKSKRN
jgi:hypothetical protein